MFERLKDCADRINDQLGPHKASALSGSFDRHRALGGGGTDDSDMTLPVGPTGNSIFNGGRSAENGADGLVERRIYDKRPLRYEYRLTEKGESFYPVLLALRAWGEKWCKAPDEGLAVRYTHRSCGKSAGLGSVCEACGQPPRCERLLSRATTAHRPSDP